jgi:hypothetical protein
MMNARRTLSLAGLALATCALAMSAAACDGSDDDPEPTDAPSATVSPRAPAATPAVTVDLNVTPGPPIAIELTANPQELVCDGEQISKVTAAVVDALNHAVKDGTAVEFEVVALGTADPINTTTTGGIAETSVVALGSQVGVVVNVSSGEAASSIRLDCQ